jgi:hypothetical protein
LEGLFVAPPGDHQPLIPVVGRLQQFVTLESVRIVNGSGACGESVGQLVTGPAGNSDGVDLDDGHPPIVPDDSRQHHAPPAAGLCPWTRAAVCEATRDSHWCDVSA